MNEQLRLLRAEAKFQLDKATDMIALRVKTTLGEDWQVVNESSTELAILVVLRGDKIQIAVCNGEVQLVVLGQSIIGGDAFAIAGSFYMGLGRLLADDNLMKWLCDMVLGKDAVWAKKAREVENLEKRIKFF